jgi:hypothetical protein
MLPVAKPLPLPVPHGPFRLRQVSRREVNYRLRSWLYPVVYYWALIRAWRHAFVGHNVQGWHCLSRAVEK